MQVVRYNEDKRRTVVEHNGSACDEDALASLLVLDEVASALDPDTEEAITESLAHLNPDLTILMVSHRTSALKYRDVVYRLEQGGLVQVPIIQTEF